MASVSKSIQPSSNKLSGELIKKIRTTNNLTQAAFGELFQPPVTQSTVARWEKGEQSPDRVHFPKIASLLDLTFEEFLELIEEPLIDFDSLDIENKILTHNKRHLAMLKKGVKTWNGWREKNPHIIPQLSGIDLALGKYSNLDGYNLDNANLAGFSGAVVSFKCASLIGANLEKAEFKECDFEGANLTRANLKSVFVIDTEFERAIFREANLNEASIKLSTFIEASLEKADIQQANLIKVNFSKAIFKKANLSDSKLFGIDFREANFNESSLERTTLTECCFYGVSFLGANLDKVKLEDIYISPKGNQGLPTNDLALAQYTYLQRHNPLLTQKFIHICNLEKEVIKLASILADKYGFHNHAEYSSFFSNYQVANQPAPFVEACRKGDYFYAVFYPDYTNEKLISSKKLKSRRFLQIENGIIESNLEFEDINILKETVRLTQEMQEEKVNHFIPIALKILDVNNNNKFIGKDFIIEKINEEIILFDNSYSKIERMRVKIAENKFEIIRSSLKDFYIISLQEVLINLLT